MRSLPTSIKEYEDNIRWVFHNYLEFIEEIVCDPSAFGTGGPDVEEVIERVQQAVELGDGEAEDKAILEGMKVQTRELWRDFPERELLGEHFKRAALRRAGTRHYRHATGPPSEEEALRLAGAMLAHLPGRSLGSQVPGAGWMNPEWEYNTIARLLADLYLREPSRELMRAYIKRSRNGVYFEALVLIRGELKRQDKDVPGSLEKWYQATENGGRGRPRERPIPNERPVALPKQLSDFNIQLCLEILRRIGIKPVGGRVSGCEVVERALEVSEYRELKLKWDTLKRIWQERPWGKRFRPVVIKNTKAIAKRHRLSHNSGS